MPLFETVNDLKRIKGFGEQKGASKELIDQLEAKHEELAKNTAKRKDKKDGGTKPTAAEREALKNELKAEKDANDAKMKTILTADQYTKWHTLQEKNKDKAKEKMKEYKKENN